MIQPERITVLHAGRQAPGAYVLYWMQAAQRAEYNHALEYAIERANEVHKPLVVFFGISDRFPEANLRHYRFMLEGLPEVRAALEQRGILFVCRHVAPPQGALELSRDAVMTVVDGGYLAVQQQWRAALARVVEPCGSCRALECALAARRGGFVSDRSTDVWLVRGVWGWWCRGAVSRFGRDSPEPTGRFAEPVRCAIAELQSLESAWGLGVVGGVC